MDNSIIKPVEFRPSVEARFDLEQAIIECWGICNDLERLLDMDASKEDIKALVNLYNKFKFDHLWATFERMADAQREEYNQYDLVPKEKYNECTDL